VDRRAFSRAFEMLDRKLNGDAFFKTFIYIYFLIICLISYSYLTYVSCFSG